MVALEVSGWNKMQKCTLLRSIRNKAMIFGIAHDFKLFEGAVIGEGYVP
jgi:hypothetical protein